SARSSPPASPQRSARGGGAAVPGREADFRVPREQKVRVMGAPFVFPANAGVFHPCRVPRRGKRGPYQVPWTRAQALALGNQLEELPGLPVGKQAERSMLTPLGRSDAIAEVSAEGFTELVGMDSHAAPSLP